MNLSVFLIEEYILTDVQNIFKCIQKTYTVKLCMQGVNIMKSNNDKIYKIIINNLLIKY